MEATGQRDQDATLAMFLASCKTVAETEDSPEFLRLGREAVESIVGA